MSPQSLSNSELVAAYLDAVRRHPAIGGRAGRPLPGGLSAG
jgi:hypothetical protein